MIALRHVWRFDAAFTAFAIQGLDSNEDGELSAEELQPLAQTNIESLAEYEYFSFLTSVERKGHELLPRETQTPFEKPQEYWLAFSDGRLTLFFTLPLKKPLSVLGKKLEIEVFDPDFFVAFTPTEEDPFILDRAPQGCRTQFQKPQGLDPALQEALAQIPATTRTLPSELRAQLQDGMATTVSNKVQIVCQ